jgi:hypothetical protein
MRVIKTKYLKSSDYEETTKRWLLSGIEKIMILETF